MMEPAVVRPERQAIPDPRTTIDERSMRALELATAVVALVSALLLAGAR